MDEIKLKPCPFCGGEAWYRKPEHESGTAFDVMSVECSKCGATPYGVSVYQFDTEQSKHETIARFWNRRKSCWIPCSERMPVQHVPVMILTDDGSYAIAHTTESEDEYLWFGDGGHYSKDYVLFWMPLPEPPKEE